jgi:hypothetical protein
MKTDEIWYRFSIPRVKGSGVTRGASLLGGLCLHNLESLETPEEFQVLDPQQETSGPFRRLEATSARQHRSFHPHFEVRTQKDPYFLKRALQGLRGFARFT